MLVTRVGVGSTMASGHKLWYVEWGWMGHMVGNCMVSKTWGLISRRRMGIRAGTTINLEMGVQFQLKLGGCIVDMIKLQCITQQWFCGSCHNYLWQVSYNEISRVCCKDCKKIFHRQNFWFRFLGNLGFDLQTRILMASIFVPSSKATTSPCIFWL